MPRDGAWTLTSPPTFGIKASVSFNSLSSRFFQIIDIFSERDGKSPFRGKIFSWPGDTNIEMPVGLRLGKEAGTTTGRR